MIRFFVLLVFIVVFSGCEKSQSNENSDEEFALLNDEQKELSEKRIKDILEAPVNLYQIEYENEENYIFPKISIPLDYKYLIYSSPYDYNEDEEYEIEDLDFFEIGDIKIREDKILKIELSPLGNYDSYGIEEDVKMFIYEATFNTESTKKLMIEELEETVVYEDENSIIMEDFAGRFSIIYMDYIIENKTVIYYYGDVRMLDLSREENLEMAYFALRNAKNLTKIPKENKKTEKTWQEYIKEKPTVVIKSYDYALRNVAKEMEFFMEPNQISDLRSIYNYSTFDLYYAVPEFNIQFNELIDSLDFGASKIQGHLGEVYSSKTEKPKLNLLSKSSFHENEFYTGYEKYGKNTYVFDCLKETTNFDDEIEIEKFKSFFYQVEHNGKTFYFHSFAKDKTEADFYSKMLDYYMNHKTLKVEE